MPGLWGVPFLLRAIVRPQGVEGPRPDYLQALLAQAGERRNAENLSEPVGVSAREMQRFLTGAPWGDDQVMGRLQEHLGPRLEHPDAVWALDGSGFPKQGRKPAGAARQQAQTGRGSPGRLPREPGRQRTPLLPVQHSCRHGSGDPGVCGRVEVAH